jgi:hypothetical protein
LENSVAVDKDKDNVYSGADVPVTARDQDDNNPNVGAPVASLGAGYTGQYSESKPYATVSTLGETTAEFNAAFEAAFGVSAPKELIKQFSTELRNLQAGRSNKRIAGKGGTEIVLEGVSAQERQNVLNKYLKAHATALADLANKGDVKASAALTRGNYGVTLTTLRNAYSENGLPANEGFLLSTALDSTLDPNKLKANINLINLQAKTYFPALADKIDKGFTVKQLLSPYLQSRANILEEDPDAIDIKELQDVAKDPKNLMNLYDYEVSLRNNPKWRFTKNAQDTMSGLARSLAQTFGLVG